MARLLGPEDYGILAVLFSFMYIFSVPSEAIQNIITAYTSRYNLNKEYGKIKYILYKSLSKSLYASFILFVLFIPLSFFFSLFLEIDFSLFLIIGILIFFFLSSPVLRGALQGQKEFFNLGWSVLIEGIIKLVLGLLLVLMGWKVYGSIFAVILSVAVSFFITFFLIKDILKKNIEEVNFKGIYTYSMPYFVCSLSIVLFYSIDVIFAKRFFESDVAGMYSVASILGKIVFFGTIGISKAMFPLTSENPEKKRSGLSLFWKSSIILLLISIPLLVLYLLFPSFIISFLFGKEYVGVSNILFIVGLSLTLLSFTNLRILYGLSKDRIKNLSFTFFFFVFIEILLFSLFHNNLTEFSLSFLVANALFFIYSLVLIRK
ncbi:oligosaccharide flippase family protein [Candidatus Pacearchaeota archaeon]|nr:oligosaccharide flippase family protein [Candidatus Pacearchaeota archaeon]